MALQSLIVIILVLVVVGFLLYLVQTKFPLDPTIKTIIYFVVVFAVILWLLQTFGLIHGLGIH